MDTLQKNSSNTQSTNTNKRKRIEDTPTTNPSAPGKDKYLNTHIAIIGDDKDDIEYTIMGAAARKDWALMATSSHEEIDSYVIIDSSCTRHTFINRSAFITYEAIRSKPITGIGNSKIRPIGRGTIKLKCRSKGEPLTVTIPNILHAPKIGVNLLSVSQLLDSDTNISFRKDGCTLT